jgi:hypothetical protein
MIDADDLARTALADLIPRSRYRLAGRSDERFTSFASLCVRICFQHLGARPSLLLFCGPGQDPHQAARLAADWAAANWRPSAIQRRVTPGVVAVHVAPAPQLAGPGAVAGAIVPAVVWTVDAGSGHVETPSAPRGGPPAGPIRRAARHLANGGEAVPIGAVGAAEREVMQVRRGYSVGSVPAVVGMVLILIGLRLAFTVYGDVAGHQWLALPRDLLLLAGIAGAAALAWDYGGMRSRLPGFSSRRGWVVAVAWGGYVVVIVIGAALLGLLIRQG